MRRPLLTAAWVAAPWTWFLVRDLHPVFDMVALGLPVIVVLAVGASVVGARLLRWRLLGLGAASWLVFGLIAVLGPWTPQPGERPVEAVRIVAANMYGDRSDAAAVEQQLVEQGEPIVIVASEINPRLLEPLGDRYGTVVHARNANRHRPADPVLITDLPVTDLGLPKALARERGVRVRVDGPAGPFVVYGLHLQRPRFGPSGGSQVSVRAHARTVDALDEAIAEETLPVVVAGDLNLVDRASGYRQLTGRLDDAVRSGWGRPTALRPIGLPFLPRIDHVLVSPEWCSADAAVFALPGSDHRGVAASVGRCATVRVAGG